jgi:hypothetical protein
LRPVTGVTKLNPSIFSKVFLNCFSLLVGILESFLGFCQRWYYDKAIEEVETTKFLDLQIDNDLNWKAHIQYIMPNLSTACFAMSTVKSLMKTETLKLVYFAYFHSIMSYGIIFCGN